MWFFGGENVVECVVNVVFGSRFFGGENAPGFWDLFFGFPSWDAKLE